MCQIEFFFKLVQNFMKGSVLNMIVAEKSLSNMIWMIIIISTMIILDLLLSELSCDLRLIYKEIKRDEKDISMED